MNYLANISRNQGDPRILSTGRSSLTGSDRLARYLGWFGIALGTVELVAPRAVSRFLGIEGREALLRAYGARELGAGMVSLSTEKQAGMWARALGDGLDLATLMGAYRYANPKRTNVGLAIGMVAGIAVLDIAAGTMNASVHRRGKSGSRRYTERSGFPGGVHQARGAARSPRTNPSKPTSQAAAAEV